MKITIPEWLTVLPDDVVPKNVTEINFHGKMTRIGDWAFENCNEIESIELPYGIVNIGYGAFQNCTKLSKIVIPDTVITIEAVAFKNCKSLRKIFIPKSVKKIEVWAFDDCDLTIYAEAKSKPEDWNLGWSNNLKIIFNAKRSEQ